MSFHLKDYHFDLPGHLIAQKPVTPRDASRLMVVDRATGEIQHRVFRELPEILDSDDLLVVNNSRVMPARLLGRRIHDSGEKGGRVEFLLLEEVEPRVWEGMFHASAKHRPGLRFEIPTPEGEPICGEILRGAKESSTGTVVARFDRDPLASGAGSMPLPPYITRGSAKEEGASPQRNVEEGEDLIRYQTVYAEALGSAAAPTAGLHFTEELFERLAEKGVDRMEVTLHVGLGTFRPVKSGDIRQHAMHSERFEVSEDFSRRYEWAREKGKRIVAVGTTSVRTLESAFEGGRLQPGVRRTEIFLYPGGRPIQAFDRLITNFHLPESTLLMLVSAFAGRELMMKAYEEAIQKEYRFFSYGDAMLIL